MADRWGPAAESFEGPGLAHFAITPNDSADLAKIPRLIYCHVAGTIVIRDRNNVDLPYNMLAGDKLDFRGVRVLATGTTGTYYGWE